MKRVSGLSWPSLVFEGRRASGAFWRVFRLFDAERRERGTSGGCSSLTWLCVRVGSTPARRCTFSTFLGRFGCVFADFFNAFFPRGPGDYRDLISNFCRFFCRFGRRSLEVCPPRPQGASTGGHRLSFGRRPYSPRRGGMLSAGGEERGYRGGRFEPLTLNPEVQDFL